MKQMSELKIITQEDKTMLIDKKSGFNKDGNFVVRKTYSTYVQTFYGYRYGELAKRVSKYVNDTIKYKGQNAIKMNVAYYQNGIWKFEIESDYDWVINDIRHLMETVVA